MSKHDDHDPAKADAALQAMVASLMHFAGQIELAASAIERQTAPLACDSYELPDAVRDAIAGNAEQAKAMFTASRSAADRYLENLEALETALWVHCPAGQQEGDGE